MAEAISSMDPAEDGTWLDGQERETVAQALRERRLTATQRASEPFVFRSGGLFGSGKKVWTVQAAVRHMDRHPDDGVYHLHNGTLARWLSEEGAEHLADLAREVMRQPEREPRINLERFLIGSGLVQTAPALAAAQAASTWATSCPGELGASGCSARKGRGRGYLFGGVRTSEPWLRVDPDSSATAAWRRSSRPTRRPCPSARSPGRPRS